MSDEERDLFHTADITRLAQPLDDDIDTIVERVADARHVFIGEASHGTSEYHRWRARLTQRLITDHGFSFVAVEGDWPDCQAVDSWVRGRGDHEVDAVDVLRRFDRWPTWMWASVEVAEFLTWLRDHNRRTGSAVGFHGLDVYSLWDSLERIVDYVHSHDSAAIDSTLSAMQCFEPYGQDPQRYAAATRLVPDGCEDEVTGLLTDRSAAGTDDGTDAGTDDDFDALQNAEVLAGAERYYRAMVWADSSPWNVRVHHMADTFDRLVDHYGSNPEGAGARGIVWAHNTHVGDARATDMANAGMTNIGQLARERHGRTDVALVGFGGFEGSVIAGRQWGAPWEEMTVPPEARQSRGARPPRRDRAGVRRDGRRGDERLAHDDAPPPGDRRGLSARRRLGRQLGTDGAGQSLRRVHRLRYHHRAAPAGHRTDHRRRAGNPSLGNVEA